MTQMDIKMDILGEWILPAVDKSYLEDQVNV